MSPSALGNEELDLLLRVWEAERVLDYPAVVAEAAVLPLERLVANEELALVLLTAHSRLNHAEDVPPLLDALRPLFSPARRDRNGVRYLFLAAENAQMHGRLVESDRLGKDALENAHALGDSSMIFWGLILLANNALIRGDFPQLLRHLNRALASFTDGSERWLPALHHNIAVAYRDMGFIAEAERHFEVAARYPRPAWIAGTSDVDRALLLLMSGDSAAAGELARRALAAFERIHWSPGLADARLMLGRIAAGDKRLDEAAEHLATASRLIPGGHVLFEAQVHEELAVLALLQGKPHRSEEEKAARLYEATEASFRLKRMRMRLESLSANPGREDIFPAATELSVFLAPEP